MTTAPPHTRPHPGPAASPTWRVYLLRCADDTLYCGVTTDLARRLRQHNGELAGGARYTRGRGPVCLIACAACTDHGDALRLEARIKSLPRQDKAVALAAHTA